MPLSPGEQKEATARTMFERAPAAVPVTPVEQMAAEMRKDLAEKGARAVAEDIKNRSNPLQETVTRRTVDNAIGFEKKADGTKLRPAGSPERKRHDDAIIYETLGREYANKGYNALTVDQQREARDLVDNTLKTLESVWPEAQVALSVLTVDQRKELIERYLRDPAFAAKARGIFDGRLQEASLVKDTVIEMKRDFEAAQRAEQAQKGEISKNAAESTNVNKRLEDFTDRTSTGGTKGKELIKLEDLERELPTIIAERDEYQSQVNDLNYYIQQRQRAKGSALAKPEAVDTTAIDNQIASARAALRPLEKELAERNEKIAEKARLETERTTLQQRKQELETERQGLDDKLKELTEERIRAQAAFASAKIERGDQEQQFVNGLKGVFSEAAFKYLDDNIRIAEEKQKALIQKEIDNTVDPAEKALLEQMRTRYDKINPATKKSEGFNKDTIDDDFNIGITQADGPEQVMRRMMAASGMTPADINAKMADPDFVKKMQGPVMERLITRKVQSGKITEHEARMIIEAPWGEKMIDNAINNRIAVKTAMEQLRQQGVLKESFMDTLKHMSSGSVLKLLLLLLGTAAVGIVPAYVAMKGALKE